jgi:hypothetical protein
MSEAFIFIGTHSIKEGKLQNLKQYEQELVALVEANEPRLIAFHIFVNEDGTQATTIQVHPDAASMAFHMQVLSERIGQAYAFLERTERIEVYGTPSDQVLEMMRQLAGSGSPKRQGQPPRRVHPPGPGRIAGSCHPACRQTGTARSEDRCFLRCHPASGPG